MPIAYTFHTTVNRIEEQFRMEHIGGTGAGAKFERISLGWYLFLDGSHEGLHLGSKKPAFAHGDKVKVTIGKNDDI